MFFSGCYKLKNVEGTMQSIYGVWHSLGIVGSPFTRNIKDKFSFFAYNRIIKKMTEWQKKKEFETTTQWKERVTEETQKTHLAEVIEEVRKEYISEKAPKTINGEIGMFDADNGIYPITVKDISKTFYVQVPTTEAPTFKEYCDKVTMTPVYGVVNDQLAVLSCSFNLNGKTYQSTNNYSNDKTSDMAISLPPLEIDLGGNNGLAIKNEVVTIDNSLDVNIPTLGTKNDKTFAVIIGNENYQRVTKVQYANNDAKTFAAYCQKTLGLPEKNIRSYNDATYGTMLAALKDIKEIADAYNGDINVIFYYAGHGIPDGKGNAYLLPVDADGTQTEVCLATSKLYQNLNELNAKKLVVFMDACFSGAQRGDGMLMAARGVAIKSVSDAPKGNAIVFSAANGEETAFPYKEKGHGMFTYFLLKKLQETKGDVTLGELAEYIKTQVGTQSVVVNRKKQTPTIVPSATANDWKSLKLR